jgi:hypothetical protein
MESGLTSGDIALMRDNNGAEGGAFVWIFALLLLMFGGNGWGNRGPMMPGNYATQADMTAGFNNQAV